MRAERHAIELVSNTLRWLLSECELEAAHPGLRSTLIGARTQVDAALKLTKEEG